MMKTFNKLKSHRQALNKRARKIYKIPHLYIKMILYKINKVRLRTKRASKSSLGKLASKLTKIQPLNIFNLKTPLNNQNIHLNKQDRSLRWPNKTNMLTFSLMMFTNRRNLSHSRLYKIKTKQFSKLKHLNKVNYILQ